MIQKATYYRFGGGVKTPGSSEKHEGKFIHECGIQPPATTEQLVEYWLHRGAGTSPGDPKWVINQRNRNKIQYLIPRSDLLFRPDAKPKFPAGITRLEDIEGYEPA